MSSEINGQRKADFSHFLDANLWLQACKLLDFQINEKIQGKNKYYKTLGMFLYERHGLISDKLANGSYFSQKVANCFFYGIPEEFYIVNYANPKPSFGHRNYKYFSAPIRAIYYSVCLYILKISQEFLSEYYRKNKKISSFYGGSLTLSKEFALNINKQSVVYYDSYKEYRKKLKKEAEKTDNKVIIRFDIQNFYDNFSPKILLANLDEMIKPSNKNAFNFDNYTAEQIVSFFAFMSAFKGGLPQTDNDVCSNFLGWLYLVFSDLKIDDELKLSGLFLKDYQLVRYVDDHFLILTFRDSLSDPDKNMFCEKLMSKISDLLYFDFGLKLNHKTSIYWLEKQEDLESFHLGIKRISQNYEIPSDEDLSFEKKIDGIFEVLSKINNLAITDAFAYQLQDIEEEKLRAIFDHGVIDYLSAQRNSNLLETAFRSFDFDLVKLFPKALTILACINENVKTNYRNFLIQKDNLSSSDCNLIVLYLCQEDFKDEELITKMKSSKNLAAVFQVFSESREIPKGSYFGLPQESIKLLNSPSLIEQMKHRRFNEINENYSLALNHLCNELCAFISCLRNEKVWESNQVQAILEEYSISNSLKIAVRNLFDRRNNNQISHAGFLTGETWGVSKDEYFRYKDVVKNSINEIYNRIAPSVATPTYQSNPIQTESSVQTSFS